MSVPTPTATHSNRHDAHPDGVHAVAGRTPRPNAALNEHLAADGAAPRRDIDFDERTSTRGPAAHRRLDEQLAVGWTTPRRHLDDRHHQRRPPVQVTVSDHSTEEVLNRPARTYRYQRTQGATVTEANTAAEERLARIVDDNLMLAQRIAEHEALAQAADLDDKVLGTGASCTRSWPRAGRAACAWWRRTAATTSATSNPCTVGAIARLRRSPPTSTRRWSTTKTCPACTATPRATTGGRWYVPATRSTSTARLGAVLVPKTAHKTRTERARATSARRKLAAKMHREGRRLRRSPRRSGCRIRPSATISRHLGSVPVAQHLAACRGSPACRRRRRSRTTTLIAASARLPEVTVAASRPSLAMGLVRARPASHRSSSPAQRFRNPVHTT